MVVEEVVEGRAFQQLTNVMQSIVAIQQSGVEVDYPRSAPACVTSTRRKTKRDSLLGCGKELGCRRRDLSTGVESQHMRHMAMPRICLLVVLNPLLNTAQRWRHLHWWQALEYLLQLVGKVVILVKNLATLDAVVE